MTLQSYTFATIKKEKMIAVFIFLALGIIFMFVEDRAKKHKKL